MRIEQAGRAQPLNVQLYFTIQSRNKFNTGVKSRSLYEWVSHSVFSFMVGISLAALEHNLRNKHSKS